MAAQLLNDIRRFLRALDGTQERLADVLTEKRTALVEAQADRLEALSQSEQKLVHEMQAHLRRRAGLLQRARENRLPAGSIRELAAGLRGPDGERLRAQLQQVRERAAELRRETWVHWIVSHRTYQHYGRMLDLIAHRGQAAPTYGGESNRDSSGGALLDASI